MRYTAATTVKAKSIGRWYRRLLTAIGVACPDRRAVDGDSYLSRRIGLTTEIWMVSPFSFSVVDRTLISP
jgi:hypothetical protein